MSKIAPNISRVVTASTVLVLAAMLLCLNGCEKPKDAAETKKKDAAPVDALEKSVERGPVKMSVLFSPKQLRLSDMARMEIVVTSFPGVEITPPAFGEAVGDFIVRGYDEKKPTTSDPNTRRFIYQLEPVHAGPHLIRTVAIEFKDKRPNSETKGEPLTLETDPIEINVTSELGDKTPSLADLAPMVPPKPLPPPAIWYWIAGALGLAAIVGGVIFVTSRRKQSVAKAEIKRSPEEIAAEELRKLLAENLHGQGQFKEFYVRLTGIVRRYIEGTTGIRAPEQTTEEFLRDMRARQVFPPERSVQLANFLEAADMVKYAAMEPSDRQIQDAIARAQEFVGLPSALTPMPVTVGAK